MSLGSRPEPTLDPSGDDLPWWKVTAIAIQAIKQGKMAKTYENWLSAPRELRTKYAASLM